MEDHLHDARHDARPQVRARDGSGDPRGQRPQEVAELHALHQPCALQRRPVLRGLLPEVEPEPLRVGGLVVPQEAHEPVQEEAVPLLRDATGIGLPLGHHQLRVEPLELAAPTAEARLELLRPLLAQVEGLHDGRPSRLHVLARPLECVVQALYRELACQRLGRLTVSLAEAAQLGLLEGLLRQRAAEPLGLHQLDVHPELRHDARGRERPGVPQLQQHLLSERPARGHVLGREVGVRDLVQPGPEAGAVRGPGHLVQLVPEVPPHARPGLVSGDREERLELLGGRPAPALDWLRQQPDDAEVRRQQRVHWKALLLETPPQHPCQLLLLIEELEELGVEDLHAVEHDRRREQQSQAEDLRAESAASVLPGEEAFGVHPDHRAEAVDLLGADVDAPGVRVLPVAHPEAPGVRRREALQAVQQQGLAAPVHADDRHHEHWRPQPREERQAVVHKAQPVGRAVLGGDVLQEAHGAPRLRDPGARERPQRRGQGRPPGGGHGHAPCRHGGA
mmetsp:Transcript_110032/g.307644  ORF Transcript_110032/g.307644 Transcript_110032/m.307644 type:complete len:507 (-) Transcript_110032:24-1544(-)